MSFEPYLRILNKWLKQGILQDKYGEFYIKSKAKYDQLMTNFYSKFNWYEDYYLQNYNIRWKITNEVSGLL